MRKVSFETVSPPQNSYVLTPSSSKHDFLEIGSLKSKLSENEIVSIVFVKKKKSGHGYVQREDDVKTQKEEGHRQTQNKRPQKKSTLQAS